MFVLQIELTIGITFLTKKPDTKLLPLHLLIIIQNRKNNIDTFQ